MKNKKKIIIIFSVAIIICILSVIIFRNIKEKIEYNKLLEMVEEYRQTKIQSFKEENEQYQDYEVDIVFLGDSLTDGYNISQYYSEFSVINRGISGDTTFSLEERLQTSAIDLKPKVIVMLIGGNNLKTMFENYENILISFKENLPQTKVVLISLSAMGGNYTEKNKIASYNNVKIKMLAEKYQYSYIDIFSALLNPETDEIYSEYTSDGVHFTENGYDIVTEKIHPVVQNILDNYSIPD